MDALKNRNKQLFIIHQGALGDFILTFPALIGLKHSYQQIDVLCQKKIGELARELGLIENAYALESAAFAPLYSDHPGRIDPKVMNILKRYSQIIIFSYSQTLETNIRHITGHNTCRVPPRPAADEKIHVSEYIINHLVGAKLLEGVELFSRPALPQTRLPAGCFHSPGLPPILLHPGSGSPMKNWPLKNVIKLAELLDNHGLTADFILGPAEYDLEEALNKLIGSSATVHIVSDLKKVLSLLNASCGFIGNDSGLCHLAALIGLPTVAIFGPSDPDRWKPMGRAVAVVRPDLDCSPCHETDKKNCDLRECFKGISPEMVCAEFTKLISYKQRVSIKTNKIKDVEMISCKLQHTNGISRLK